MKKLPIRLITFLAAVVFMASCNSPKKGSEEPPKDAMTETNASSGEAKYKIYKAPPSLDFPEAGLELLTPKANTADTGDIGFKFKVTNYELGVQTGDAPGRGIANSAKGQHIHFIVNNGPYSAHYGPEFTKNMPDGIYVILAFLSRSYHESVKNDNSYVIKTLTVGDPDAELNFDETAPHLFFSRPKGTYSGKDTEKLMIDFFLLNTSLSPDGNKVKATVNGEEFLITEWAPYFVEGLEKGEATIQLELIDKDGNIIPGPYNSAERKVTLE